MCDNTTCCYVWFTVALRVVIIYQTMLQLQYSTIAYVYFVYWLCIVESQAIPFLLHSCIYLTQCELTMGHAVAQLVEALRYKSEGRGFDSRWCHLNFSLT